jgi:phage tail sheath protein FI
MALLNTNIGPERVQVFDQPIGTVPVAGSPTSVTAMLISSGLSTAPVNTPTTAQSLDEFVTAFGGADYVADDGYYAAEGFFANGGDGNQLIVVNVGQGTAEVSSIVCVADVANSLRGKYFRISSAYDRKKYYVWFTTASVGTDPSAANSGRTGVKVNVATGATATQVGAAVAAALNPMADFNATASTGTVTLTNAQGGPAEDATAGDSGFTVTVSTQGARPSANSYIGDAALGTGLRALDTQDTVGLVCAPGLPLETAYLVHNAVIDYAETIRAEFGSTLSTSFSLVAVPKEIVKANTDVAQLSALTISGITGLVISFSVPLALSGIKPGMVIKKAGGLEAVISAVDDTLDTITVVSLGSLAVSDVVDICMPSAVTYKDFVVNNPSRVASWYFNSVIMTDRKTGAASGALVTVDACGHVAGVMARIDANTAIGGVSHAPAGSSFAAIASIQGLALAISERLDAAPLRLAYINRITSFPGLGNVIYGGYTAGGAAVTADERLIQVMRTLQFIKGSLEAGLKPFIWENFSPVTQEKISNAITSFMRNNIYLFPAGLTEDEQFRVITVTPSQTELDAGLLRVRLQVRPNTAVRFIEIALEFPIPAA